MNPRRLPPRLAATLAKGLRDDSRVMRKLSGVPPVDIMLQAMTLDALRWLQWSQTRDGAKNRNRPESVAEKLFSRRSVSNETASGYDNGADFDKAWKELMGDVQRNKSR